MTQKPPALRFIHDNAASSRKRPPETMSGGVGLLDYDGDGWLDVYAVQGGPLPPRRERPLPRTASSGTAATGRFEDVSERAGLRRMPGGYGHGVTVGDYDNDGRPDLFVTRWRSYLLLHNRGDGTFEDVTDAGRAWPAIATGRPPRPGPTWTATAISTSMSAITWSSTSRSRRSATRQADAWQSLLQPARLPGASRSRLPQ